MENIKYYKNLYEHVGKCKMMQIKTMIMGETLVMRGRQSEGFRSEGAVD